MGLTRPYTKKQKRHPGSRSKSHQDDKALGDARKAIRFVAVATPERPSPKRPFSELGLKGHELRHDDVKGWARCIGDEDFADYLEGQGRSRGWFKRMTTRKGEPCLMRRPARPPFEVLTISCAPWLSDWTKDELCAGRNPREKLALIRNDWLKHAVSHLAGERYVIGFACHVDTDDLHFDLITSRQDGQGGQIGSQGLYTAGDWTVGATRQVRAGATISKEKAQQVRHNIAAFRGRYGETAVPLDIELSRSLDRFAADVIGAPLKAYMDRYAASVPGLERDHRAAEIAAIDATRARLVADAAAPNVPPSRPAGAATSVPLDL